LKPEPHASNWVIDLQDVSLQHGNRTILRHLHLQLRRGVVAVLYGANGAGKSTLLKLLAGLQTQAKVTGVGNVLEERLWPRPAAARARLGYMPQHGGLYEELTVQENIEFRLAMFGVGNAQENAKQSAKEHGLTQVWQQKIGELSGGWKQRVAFAVTLLAKPALVLLDEPTAGVDLEAKAQIWQRIQELKRRGVSVLVSTHDSDEARRADQLINLQSGQVNYIGTPDLLCTSFNLRSALLQFATPTLNEQFVEQSKLNPNIIFCEQDEKCLKVVWHGHAAIDDFFHKYANAAASANPSFNDGLRALLGLAEKRHA
jgi:ABC-2 type transport system ATP-binding protein